MSSLLSDVVPLALGAAISPVLFLLQLNTLTGPRPITRGLALTAGAAIVLIIGSTIGVLVGDTGFSTRDTLQAVINIAFGALLIAVGLRALLKPPKPKTPEPDPKPPTVGRAFVLGVGGMASNVTTFALYIPALALIAGSGLPLRQQGIAALIILLITLMVACTAPPCGRGPGGIDASTALAGTLDDGEQPVDPGRPGARLRHLAPGERREGAVGHQGSVKARADYFKEVAVQRAVV